MKTSIFLSSRSHMITHRAARNNSSIQFVRYLLYLVCTLCVTSFLVCLMSFNVYTIHLNVICRSQICDGLIQCTIIITVSCFVSQFWQLYTWWCWCVYTRCDGHILSSSSMLCVRSLFFSPFLLAFFWIRPNSKRVFMCRRKSFAFTGSCFTIRVQFHGSINTRSRNMPYHFRIFVRRTNIFVLSSYSLTHIMCIRLRCPSNILKYYSI